MSALTALLLLVGSLVDADQLGTSFTYQGRLTDSGAPANGLYDFRFTVFDAVADGNALTGTFTNTATPVSNGLFTVTLDFGAGLFTGEARWLRIGVRSNGVETFSTLTPNQPLSPVPYALFAPGAGVAAGVATNAVMAEGISGGQVVKSLNALHDQVTLSAGTNVSLAVSGNEISISATPGSVVTNAGWSLFGNSGTTVDNFLGTTDGRALELRVGSARALRIAPTTDTPNLIGGYSGNRISQGIVGGTIGGGGTVLGSQPNAIVNNGQYGTIAGGYNNMVTNYGGAVLGGSVHLAGGWFAAVGAGQGHTNLGDYSWIGGGQRNLIQAGASYSTISGGFENNIQAGDTFSSIGGGWVNSIGPNAFYSTIAGGHGAKIGAGSPQSTVSGGFWQTIGTNAESATISGGNHNTVGAGATEATISGGIENGIGDGAYQAVVSGGYDNQVTGFLGTIGGGTHNRVGGPGGTVPGGNGNWAAGVNALAAGTQAHATNDGSFVWADYQYKDFVSTAPNQFLIRARGGVGIGTNAPQSMLHVAGEATVKVLTITGGADVAEPFELSTPEVPKGAVMVIDSEHPGKLKLSDHAYDTRVAGIVSGANGIQPGLSLRQGGALDGIQHVALSGRVYVQADASNGAIQPGDLLTTSGTPGYAMRVTDHPRAQGAILGKAMTPLDEGKGLVLVLVTLQ